MAKTKPKAMPAKVGVKKKPIDSHDIIAAMVVDLTNDLNNHDQGKITSGELAVLTANVVRDFIKLVVEASKEGKL